MSAREVSRALLALSLCCGAGCGGGAQQSRARHAEGAHSEAASGERERDAELASAPEPEPDAYRDRKPVVVLEGQATYYSDSLAGNETSNGEVYRLDRLTAASRDLPFGSIVRVIRRDTGASVIVRINDRGPFGSHKRILDLSHAAAEKLHMLGRGVAPVRAEVLHLGPTPNQRHRH